MQQVELAYKVTAGYQTIASVIPGEAVITPCGGV